MAGEIAAEWIKIPDGNGGFNKVWVRDSTARRSIAQIQTEISDLSAADVGAIPSSEKGAVSGVAELDASGKVPSSQLPSYVDDVLEYSSSASFPATGEAGKIYVDLGTNLTYRWSGSAYVEISPSLALGTTSSTAFRGDHGDAAYQHAVTNKGSAFSSGLYKITTNAEGHVTGATAVAKSDITSLGIPGSVPSKTSDLTNDSGFLTSVPVESVNGQTGVVALTASDVGAIPSGTTIPTKTSDLTNDSGFITSAVVPTKTSDLTNDSGYITGYTETDPTVPSWAKASSKPTYTASEVGALPSSTVIPSKTSDLTNDSGFITGYTETDPTVPAWAKAASKPSYTASEVGALPSNTVIPSKTSDLTNDSGFVTLNMFGVPTAIPASANLNNYTTPGHYSADTSAIAKTLTNAPTTGNFTLFVYYRTTTLLNQLAITSSKQIYTRGQSSSGWGSWSTITGS